MKAVEAHEAINGLRSSSNLLNGGGQDQGFYPHKATLLAEAVQKAKLQAFAVDDGRTKRFGFGTFFEGNLWDLWGTCLCLPFGFVWLGLIFDPILQPLSSNFEETKFSLFLALFWFS